MLNAREWCGCAQDGGILEERTLVSSWRQDWVRGEGSLAEPEGWVVFRCVNTEWGKQRWARTRRGMSSSAVILWLESEGPR